MALRTNFKPIPQQDELRGIERDLRFHRSEVASPRVLTPDQVAAFNRDGYLKCLRVFSDAEMAEHRAYFDDLLARVLATGGDSYSINTAHARYGRVFDLLTHPRIVAYVRDIL